MENDISKNNLKTQFGTIVSMPRYTYVPNMGTLSQTMPREWPYLDHLA